MRPAECKVEDRLTNTRVLFCDPRTRWAVLMFGQGMHLPHHLFPSVPNYRLARLHRLLFRGREDFPTIHDKMSGPRTPERLRSSRGRWS